MKDRKSRSDQWNPEEVIAQEIIKKYEEGKSAWQLGREYEVADVTITSFLKRCNVSIRNASDARRTNQIKEDIFDTITEESAYWIGFLLTDGNVYYPPKRSKQLNLGLAKRDWEHLEKFKKFIGSNKKLYYNKNNGGVYISFYSNRIVEKLAEYGIVPKKSTIAKIPESLKDDRHFWRGIIDGDGWISYSKRGYPIVGLCGTFDILECFRSFVGKSVSIYVKNTNFGELAYTCIVAQAIFKILYEDCNIFLQRKYDKYQQFRLWTPSRKCRSKSIGV